MLWKIILDSIQYHSQERKMVAWAGGVFAVLIIFGVALWQKGDPIKAMELAGDTILWLTAGLVAGNAVTYFGRGGNSPPPAAK